MIGVSEERMQEAMAIVSKGNPEAVGYRLLVQQVYPIAVDEHGMGGLSAGEKSEFETLSSRGFVGETKSETERQEKGTPYGILIGKGDAAFSGNNETLSCEIGDVVITDRYAGIEFEIPPKSGNMFRFMNDTAVLGVMK